MINTAGSTDQIQLFDNKTSSSLYLDKIYTASMAANSSTLTTMNSSTVMTIDNMSGSAPDDEDILHYQNLQFMSLLNPTILFLCFLMIVGVMGNAVVFLIYYKKFKPSTTRVYVLAMSVCDLLTNVLVVAIEIAEIRFHYTFNSGAACQINGTVVSVLVLFSAFHLVAVARDRHKKVCWSKQPPTSVRDVYVGVLANGLLSVVLTVPHSIMRGPHRTHVPGTNITGVTCNIDDKYVESLFPVVYHAITGLVFLLCVGVMAFCYIRIAIRLRQHKNHAGTVVPSDRYRISFKNASQTKNNTSGDTTDTSDVELSSVKADGSSACRDLTQQEDSRIQDSAHNPPLSLSPQFSKEESFSPDVARETDTNSKEETEVVNSNENRQTGPRAGSLTKSTTGSSSLLRTAFSNTKREAAPLSKRDSAPGKPKGQRKKKIPSSTTWMMFVLTAVFVVNYLPYLIVVSMPVLRDPEHGGLLLNTYHVALRSWFINSAVNPLVYSICSARFRLECRHLFCRTKA